MYTKSSKLMFPIKFMFICDVTSCWSKGGSGKLLLNTNCFSNFSSKLTLIVNSRICWGALDVFVFFITEENFLRNELSETGTLKLNGLWTYFEAVQNPLQLTACKDVIIFFFDDGPKNFFK